jgi:DNA-binding MarR family transcriptional regulator
MTTSAPADLAPDLMFLLSQASHVLSTELTAGLAGLGVSPRAHCVLRKALTGDWTQSQLAEMCGLDKTTMVVTMDELERAGLAERRPDRDDRRARIVGVTEAGRQVAARAETIVDCIQESILEVLPAAERSAFVAGLVRLVGSRLARPVRCEPPVRRRLP